MAPDGAGTLDKCLRKCHLSKSPSETECLEPKCHLSKNGYGSLRMVMMVHVAQNKMPWVMVVVNFFGIRLALVPLPLATPSLPLAVSASTSYARNRANPTSPDPCKLAFVTCTHVRRHTMERSTGIRCGGSFNTVGHSAEYPPSVAGLTIHARGGVLRIMRPAAATGLATRSEVQQARPRRAVVEKMTENEVKHIRGQLAKGVF